MAWTASSSHSADVFSISGLSTKTCSCMRVDPRWLAVDRPPHGVHRGHSSPFCASTAVRRAVPSGRVPGSYRRAAGPRLGRIGATGPGPPDEGMREHRYSFEMPHAAAEDLGAVPGLRPLDRLCADGAPGRGDLSGRRAPQRPTPTGHLQDALRTGGNGARAGHRRGARPWLHLHDDLRTDPATTRSATSGSSRWPPTAPASSSTSSTTSPRGRGAGSRVPSTGSSTRTTRTACGGRRRG